MIVWLEVLGLLILSCAVFSLVMLVALVWRAVWKQGKT